MIESPHLALLREQLPALLTAIPGADPAGVDQQHDHALGLLREARREDDCSLPRGVWESELKRADWAKVEHIANDILARHSKDLTVAAWLGEAWLHRYRFDGLYAALELMLELGERYGEALHPRPQNGDHSWLAPPLAWMARRYSETLLSRIPLLDVQIRDVEVPTQLQWQETMRKARNKSEDRRSQAEAAESQADLRTWADMVLSVPLADIQQQVQVLQGCGAMLGQLNRWCDEQLLDEAPSLGALQTAIEHILQTLQELIAIHPQPVIAPVLLDVVVESVSVETPAPAVAAVAMGIPDSRDAAYQQLKVISQYLASVEPHSPVPYLIERAIEWGHMPLRDLLGELVNADVDTRRIWSVLGVLP